MLNNEALAAQRDKMQQQRDQLVSSATSLPSSAISWSNSRISCGFSATSFASKPAQVEFLANVSHELHAAQRHHGLHRADSRRRLALITGEAHDATDGVLASSANLLRLINQILDLSRIEAGKMDVHAESVELSALVAAVIKKPKRWGAIVPIVSSFRVLGICGCRPIRPSFSRS